MSDPVTVDSKDIHRLYAALKAAGEGGGLGRRLTKAIREATKPAKDAAKASAAATLPGRGGLGALIGSSKFTNVVKTGSRSAGVEIKAASGHDIKRIDEGTVRHPTWGHAPWVAQAVTPGWFTKPLLELAPEVEKAIAAAMADTAKQLAALKG